VPGPAPVVLAYSGRPGAGAAIARLSAAAGAPVVTVTLDLGQGADLEQIAGDARHHGALRAHVVDARAAFAADVILPALRAGATGAGVGVRGVALARPTIATALVDVARIEGATRVAHGASGDDRLAMNLLLSELAPDLSVVDFAVDSGVVSEPAVAANLWGRTVTVPSGVDPETLPPGLLYQRTSPPAACQARPATVEITFEHGLPVAVNGIAMPFVEIVEVVETIAGDHGVGRSEAPAASGVREITEAPAPVTLGLALAEIERTTLAPRLAALKASLSWAYAAAIDDGAWFSTSRAALDAFVVAASVGVTGVVRVQLFQGGCRVAEPDATGAGTPVSSVEAGL
jgi:argininosuccinate synthase